jgi:hypothetical protein
MNPLEDSGAKLVDLVYLVSFVQPKKLNKPNNVLLTLVG